MSLALRAVSIVAVVIAAAPIVSGHELLVGRLGDHIHMHYDAEPFEIPVSPFPQYPGYADTDPGFVALPVDLPDGDLFTLPPQADIVWTLLAISPGMHVLNDTGTAYLNVGESYTLGMPLFHVHPLWHIPDGVVGEVYSVTIRLHDRSGTLEESEDYQIDFTPVPEPATAALLLATAALLRRRSF